MDMDKSTMDILDKLDRRLQTFEFKSSTLPFCVWNRTSVARKIYSREKSRIYRTKEDQLLYRMELWINACYLNAPKSGKNKGRLSYVVGQCKPKTNMLKQTASLESIAIPSMITSSHPKTMKISARKRTKRNEGFFKFKKKLGLSASANDVSASIEDISVDIDIIDSNPSLLGIEDQRKSKKGYLFNMFTKKSDKCKVGTTRYDERVKRYRTPEHEISRHSINHLSYKFENEKTYGDEKQRQVESLPTSKRECWKQGISNEEVLHKRNKSYTNVCKNSITPERGVTNKNIVDKKIYDDQKENDGNNKLFSQNYTLKSKSRDTHKSQDYLNKNKESKKSFLGSIFNLSTSGKKTKGDSKKNSAILRSTPDLSRMIPYESEPKRRASLSKGGHRHSWADVKCNLQFQQHYTESIYV